MRNALNNDPRVQIGVVAVLLVVVGFFLMSGMKKKDTTPATTTTGATLSTPQGSVDVNVAVTPSAGGAAPTGGTSGSVAPTATGTVTPEALKAGRGLPADVIGAWKRGAPVVVFVYRGGGIDDKLVDTSVEAVSAVPRIAVFTVRAQQISRFSRITQALGVDRVPALVVIKPRKGTSETPEAQVSYGFRSTQGVLQAVKDALYTGPDNQPYYPR
jgi:hypothetical protein